MLFEWYLNAVEHAIKVLREIFCAKLLAFLLGVDPLHINIAGVTVAHGRYAAIIKIRLDNGAVAAFP